MQFTTTTSDIAPAARLTVPFELIAYAFPLVLALVLRLAELDTVPLSAPEARQALAAWRSVYPAAPAARSFPTAHCCSCCTACPFSLLGSGEMSVRWATALAGMFVALCLSCSVMC